MPTKTSLTLLLCLSLVGCGEPIVARTPNAVYNLAKQQLDNGQFRAAGDSLQRVMELDPNGEFGRRALVLRTALLAAMTRSFQSLGEDHLAGYKQGQSPELRTVGMGYFSRARGRALELMDVLEQALKQPATSPYRVDYWPAAPTSTDALQKARQGQALSETELNAAERAAMQRSLGEALNSLAGKTGAPGGAEAEVEPAVFFLGAAKELVRLASLFQHEALNERALSRLSLERAATLARQAEQLAQAAGNQKIQAEAGEILRQCEEALKKR